MASELPNFAAGAAAVAAMGGQAADVVARLNGIMQQDAAAAAIAASAGASVAQVKAAIAANARAAADAVKAEADAHKDAAKAAEKAAKEEERATKEAAEAVKKHEAAVDKAGQPTREFGESLSSAASNASRVPGPIGAVQDALAKLGPQGQAAALALGVATAAVTALTVAILGGMAAAISIVSTRAALLSTFAALGGGEAAGKATLAMVEKLSESLPFTTDQIAKWATAMERAGLKGKDLEAATKAIAAAAALNPEGGAAAAEAAIAALSSGGKEASTFLKSIQEGGRSAERKLREMGLSLDDLGTKEQRAKMSAEEMARAIEKALQKKGAGPLDAMGATFPVIIAKLKEGLLSLFDGLGPSVQPFMAAVKSLFGEFGKGGAVTKALKPVITEVFGTLFSWATKAVTLIHEAFQQVVIAALKARIALDPVIKKIKEFAQSESFIRGLKIALIGLGIGAFLAVLPMIILVAVFALFVAAMGAVVAGIVWVVGWIGGKLAGAFRAVSAAVKGFKFPNLAAAAANMITSFTSAISAKISAVASSMAAMGAAAKKALFGALGIASPSRVALEAAGNVTSTFADTVDDGKGKTQAAFAGMVKVPPPGKGGRSGRGGGGSDRLAAAVERLANALEASPTFREMLVAALQEAERSGDDMVRA